MSVDMARPFTAPEPMTPLWWVHVLHKRLNDRRPALDEFQAYYEGDHPAPWLPAQAQREFHRLLTLSRSNICGLIVDATAERLAVEGFRLGPLEQAADADTWRIWQANNLDAYFDQGILEALIGGASYLLVAPNGEDPKTPHMWVEHASQAVVAFEPGTNRRVRKAGLKVWADEWTGGLEATLYLPDWIYKFRSDTKSFGTPRSVVWEPREVSGESWPARNPLGEVPLYEVANRPRLLAGGVSELADVLVIQDRINKTLADRLMAQDFGAFPQKWATAYPDTDEAGNLTPPIDVGHDRMVTTSVKETKFGQWDAAPLDPYSSAKREDTRDAASRTRTPAQYLLGDMANVNGATLQASESGLVSKCRQAARYMGEPVEDAARSARRMAGLPDAGDAGMETIWRDPEYRTEGERVDALVKMATLRVPDEALWERWGATQSEIARWRDMRDQQSADPTLERITRDLIGAADAAAPVDPDDGVADAAPGGP